MNIPKKCYKCKKPLTVKNLVSYNDGRGTAYVLCPWGNCQAINFLPTEIEAENGNPVLREWVKGSSKK